MEKEEKEIEEFEEQEDEESGLEEDIKEAEEDKFVEFITPSDESLSTSLDQVGVAHQFRATDLEQDLSAAPAGIENDKNENNDQFKYTKSLAQEEESKYVVPTQAEQLTMPSHVDVSNLGREPTKIEREVGFLPSTEDRDEPTQEKYELPKEADPSNLGKGEIFKQDEVKYELN